MVSQRALNAEGAFLEAHDAALKKEGSDRSKAWTLFILATDPDEEGKGALTCRFWCHIY